MLYVGLLLAVLHPPPKGQWAVDETGRVSQAALQRFNTIAAELDAAGGGQLGLAVVASTRGGNPRQFATKIFNAWGVGHHGRNDGVLLFFALDDRKSEIVLGDGFPSGATAYTDDIMRVQVVANMKAGQLDQAVTDAADALSSFVVGQLGGQAPVRPSPANDEAQSKLDELAWGNAPLPEKSPRGWLIDLGYPLSPEETAELDRIGDALYAEGNKGLLFVALYQGQLQSNHLADKLRKQLHRDDVWVVTASMPDGAVRIEPEPLKQSDSTWVRAAVRIEGNVSNAIGRADALVGVASAMKATAELMREGPPIPPVGELIEGHEAPLAGGTGSLALAGLIVTRRWLRRRPRNCSGCDNPRHLLCEATDDPHLNPGQQHEEQLGSVDYDVWWCGRCNDALVLRYGAIFTRYSTCRSCRFKTMTSSSVTLVAATYDHGGTVEVTERCQHCAHVHTYTRYTSQLTRSDSSSSSSSSSFSGGSSSGSGSSGSW